jgi:succinate dehydrogenase/fumarate reductase flavoprotein subunit
MHTNTACFSLTVGPNPHLRGYRSRSMTTRLIFATTPWSQLASVDVVIRAMADEQKQGKGHKKYYIEWKEKFTPLNVSDYRYKLPLLSW